LTGKPTEIDLGKLALYVRSLGGKTTARLEPATGGSWGGKGKEPGAEEEKRCERNLKGVNNGSHPVGLISLVREVGEC